VKSASARLWELDALRGLAVLAMVAYHCFFTAAYIGLSRVDPYSGPLGASPLFIAGTFLLISGMSLRLDLESGLAAGRPPAFKRYAKRSGFIALWALVFSAVTFVAAGLESFVAFGILHCVALCGVILYPLIRFRWANLGLGLAAVVSGFLFFHDKAYPAWAWWLLALGPRPEGYYPIDFVPLLPWAGFCLLGFFAASLLYMGGRRRYPWPFGGRGFIARGLSFMGRHSLAIYVVHIPIIMGILLLVKLAAGA
jgi:uncharacterized membrane protein